MTITQDGFTPLADQVPPAAGIMAGARGNSAMAAREDHTHAIKVQRKHVISDASGIVNWVFSTPFSVPPAVAYMVENASGQPMIANIIELDEFHVKVQVFQTRLLPSTLVLLTNLINYSIISTVGANVGLNLFAAEPTP